MLFISWLSRPCPRTVGRGPVPRRASVLTANVHGLLSCGRFSFRRRDCGGKIICLVSVGQDRLILTRSGSGDPELLRCILIQPISIAGDRPPRYGNSSVFFREITLTKNATFAKINSVLNIFGDFSREFDCFYDFSQKNVDKKPKFM